jgi:hypothetical protein
MSSRSSVIFPTSCTFWADVDWMREVRGPFWLSAAALIKKPSPKSAAGRRVLELPHL